MSQPPTTSRRAGLFLNAHLTISRGGHQVNIRAQDQTIVVEAADSDSLTELLNAIPRRGAFSGLRKLSRTLQVCGVRVEIRLRGKPKVVIGDGAESHLFRLLGLPHFQGSLPFLIARIIH